ncbi:uncharacterized protein TRAVEDRAFT_42763 [Trametes versicolor FP-101664 SS1]|uniref:uncharacterized protein n=1 Tax=Trametes versicolor (strain FP-101664) TaxID=717944 RepID=UPI0004621BC2|nr:uncharacterized protein TRAVEDRAFT_42763 [Trametes versicolor FP-101664 SS1]EIW65393.1 hypothetical protein TRAVEDRAFT_42763 [Trametes versicolor FP-101664 SS1]
MESSRLPIELCEAIMNALPDYYEFCPPLWLADPWDYVDFVLSQCALYACALTCHAWRVRAQYLLSTFPHIRNHANLAHFTMAVEESPITGLTLGGYYDDPEPFDASKASELFMRSCPRLQHLRCLKARFDRGPPVRLLRMLPFFASITTLQLWECTFQNFRAMMDVVWACPNLAMLEICAPGFKAQPSSPARLQQIHVRPIGKLTCPAVHFETVNDLFFIQRMWGPDSARLSGVGRVFGCAVTELYFEMVGPYSREMLGNLLRDSFPALRSVTVFYDLGFLKGGEDGRALPWLHIIAIGRPIPGRLKRTVLQDTHNDEDNHCCMGAVGTSENVAGSEKWLPELLSGLEELTIRLDKCKDPENLAHPYSFIASLQTLRTSTLSPPRFYHNFLELFDHPTDIGSSISGIAPSPIFVSPSMESCLLPIELCEKVMDAIPHYVEFSYTGSRWPMPPKNAWDSQQALWACALTCHAWHVRAQYLLWTFPCLIQSQQFPRFNAAIRKSLNTPTICGLALGALDVRHEASDLSTAGELFMHSFPHLRYLLCQNISFERGPSLRVLHTRMPFFSSITSLELWGCTFQSLRGMLNIVWACFNLATLNVVDNEVKWERHSAAETQALSAAARSLRACRKLTRLYLKEDAKTKFWRPADVGVSGVGRVFGCAVTELVFHTDRASEAFISLFKDSFPALRSVTIAFAELDENREHPSWLHVILATGRPIPGILKTIVLDGNHLQGCRNCCENAVGTSEEVVGSAQRLPELLPELAELVLRLDWCKDPASHAAYIWNILPGMRNVLRFEYRADVDEGWKPYTILPQDFHGFWLRKSSLAPAVVQLVSISTLLIRQRRFSSTECSRLHYGRGRHKSLKDTPSTFEATLGSLHKTHLLYSAQKETIITLTSLRTKFVHKTSNARREAVRKANRSSFKQIHHLQEPIYGHDDDFANTSGSHSGCCATLFVQSTTDGVERRPPNLKM